MRVGFKVLSHCSLWLGVAFAAPAWSQPQGPTGRQVSASAITTDTSPSDRNWHAFWRHHLGRWDGSWTRYTPSGAVKETFASTREFTANQAKTEIVQSNRYLYANGRSIAKEWSYNIEDHSHPDGFAHPASRPMRGLALNNGTAAWLIPSLQANQVKPFELFLTDGDIRHSVGVLYGPKGDLLRTASIREQRGKTSNGGWTDAIQHVEPWQPLGPWQGQERQIRRDLSLIPVQRVSWQWVDTERSNQSIHYFPDGIILRCPERLWPGQAISIEGIWMLNDNEIQTITATYNSKAELLAITHQDLKPLNRSEGAENDNTPRV